jgi:hypothetical protein
VRFFFFYKLRSIIRVFITIKKACGEKSAFSPQADKSQYMALIFVINT